MKIYSYTLVNDNGFAPNPFWGVCTLATDQALIRQIIAVGDWVVGLDRDDKDNIKLIYAMHIDEKLTFEEYWQDKRFQIKKPDLKKKDHVYQVGDNIYSPNNDDFNQLASLHSVQYFDSEDDWKRQKKQDLQGKFVLVGSQFYYFGKEPIDLPSKRLVDELFCDVGYKCIADPVVPKEFEAFIQDLEKKDKKGLMHPPQIWPAKDSSWKTT
jgi:hypothetical protein